MLQVDVRRVQAVRSAEKAEDLYEHLQGAIELEHATIPVYFTALLSLKDGSNREVAGILRSVFMEEMLHMCIACNVLNAIGGSPVINKPAFVPTYPGPLPMNIETGLRVHLAPLSPDQLVVFTKIEQPEHPLTFPSKVMSLLSSPTYATIGQFYQALIEKIQQLGDAIFTGAQTSQVVNAEFFPEALLFAIHDSATAVRALRIVVEQGEGTSKSPLSGGELAHYYRFKEIAEGRKLVADSTVEEGFSYTGAAIPFDASGVWNMVVDSKAARYPAGSTARTLVDQFNAAYTTLLNQLHDAFNGSPDSLESAIGSMFSLTALGKQIAATTDSVTGKQAAPSYEFLATNVVAATS